MAKLKTTTEKDGVPETINQSGWPEQKHNLPTFVTPYFHFRDKLMAQDGLILLGDRVATPKANGKTESAFKQANKSGKMIFIWPSWCP